MFRKFTTFVVGAGASFDGYGLPLGTTLASEIAKASNFYFEHYSNRPSKGDADFFEQVLWRKFSGNRDVLNKYTAAGQKLAAAISSTVSVDDALYQLSEFPEAVELGKLLIMRLILAAEGNSTLKIDPNFGQPSHSAGRDGWIEQVFSMAITGLKLRQMTQAFENVAFINFNYDRCIEHYLFWSFQRIGLPANDAAEMVQNLNMVRPYGSLGSILSGSKNYLQFGAGRIPEPFSVIERIRTFTESEAMHDPAALSKLLSSSEMIIFLGFGFHPQNMELLTIQQRPQSYLGVLATTYMVDAANLRALQGAITRSLRAPGKVVETFSMTASEFLKKLRMRITLTVG